MRNLFSLALVSMGLLVISGHAFVFGKLEVIVHNSTKERIYLKSLTIIDYDTGDYSDYESLTKIHERWAKEITKNEFDEFSSSNPIASNSSKTIKWGSRNYYAYAGFKFEICAMSSDGDAQKVSHFCSGEVGIKSESRGAEVNTVTIPIDVGNYKFNATITFSGLDSRNEGWDYDDSGNVKLPFYYYTSLTITISYR